MGDKIRDLCEFIKEHGNIHQSIRVMIRGIRLVFGKAQDEKKVKVSSEKMSHVTQVMPIQIKRDEKCRKDFSE